MTFRARFFTLFSLAVLAGTGCLAWAALRQAQQTYQRFGSDRDTTLTTQFQREIAQRGHEVSYSMQGLADAEATLRMVLDLGRPNADPSVYANDARGLATAHQLDFLDVVAGDGTLISSAQWPARSGYKADWVTNGEDWNHRSAFLQRVDLPDGVELGLLAVRTVAVGEKSIYLIGGLRFDREFLRSVALPSGTRALLYSNLGSSFAPENLTSADGAVDQPDRFAGIVADAEKSQSPLQRNIQWTADRGSAEDFMAIPLIGRQNEPLGVVLLGSTQRELAALENAIVIWSGLIAGLGILGGLLLSGWAARRASKPLVQVTAGVRQVTAGNWAARVEGRSREEAGELAKAFNEMTAHLSRERTRLVQTERVAAWRDVTQRMSQEVKQYLFPMEVTVSGLARARAESSPRFGEVLNESLAALRTELDELKAVVNRFSEFAKMPQPRCKPVDVNEILRGVMQAFETQFRALGRPPITPELALDNNIGKILADPDLLRRAFDNLLLHSIDTMPSGGTLMVRTTESNNTVRIQISGSGTGFGSEQRSDPFTAFRARQTLGAALGLPTTQAVVSDHGGRFFAETIPGVGTTFHLEFAVTKELAAPPSMHLEAPKREIRRDSPAIPQDVLDAIAPVSPEPISTEATPVSPTSPATPSEPPTTAPDPFSPAVATAAGPQAFLLAATPPPSSSAELLAANVPASTVPSTTAVATVIVPPSLLFAPEPPPKDGESAVPTESVDK